LDELAEGEGPQRFLALRLKNLKAPGPDAEEIAGKVKELKKEGEAYSGDFTEEGAKYLVTFVRGGVPGGPTVNSGKGAAKFWVKDGQLSKYEYHVEGSIKFNGEDRDMDRTTTIEIKDVGTTKVEVPDGAKKKLS
jgi:hypothetical protein